MRCDQRRALTEFVATTGANIAATPLRAGDADALMHQLIKADIS